MQSDLELLEALQKGNRGALLKLASRRQVALYNFFHALTGDDSRAIDLCVRAFEQIFMPSSSPRPQELPFTLYLYRVARECYLRQAHGGSEALALPSAAQPHPLPQPPPPLAPAINQAAPAARQDGTALLECLSPELRVLLVLKEAGQLSYDEIARVLDAEPDRVARKIRAAYRYLRAGSACRAALPEPHP